MDQAETKMGPRGGLQLRAKLQAVWCVHIRCILRARPEEHTVSAGYGWSWSLWMQQGCFVMAL